MKGTILGSTALVAVGAVAATPAAAKIELGLGGYMNSYFSVASINEGSNDPRDFNPTGLFSQGEVQFSGEYTADNGIVFGAYVSLELLAAGLSEGDRILERYAHLTTSLGAFYAGSTNSAAYQMHYAAPFAGVPINSGWVTVFIPPNPDSSTAFVHPALSTYIDFGLDDNTLTYYTPRIAGFQLGISYVPSVAVIRDGKNFPVEADTETEYANGVSVGVNYVEEFDSIFVAVSAGWRYAQAPEAFSSLGYDDYQAVSFGVNLCYSGFCAGGSYANEYDGMIFDYEGELYTTEGQSWDVGATYSLGPWTFGLTYFHGATDDYVSDPGEDTLQAIQGGLYFEMGPGITAGAGVLWADWETESDFSNSGVSGTVGLTFSF